MSDRSLQIPQSACGSVRFLRGTLQDASQDPRSDSDICQSNNQEPCQSPRRDNSRMGKPRLNESTREAKRLALLIDMLARGEHPEHGRLSQLQVERLTGVEASHLNKIFNADRPRGVGADIIRKMRDGLKIDPMFFFDDKEPTDLNVYILAEKRIAKRFETIEERLAALESMQSNAPPDRTTAPRRVKR